MLLYLHGFCSSPASAKTRLLKAHMAARGLGDAYWCEQLPPSPKAAMALVESVIAHCPAAPTLIGSSLGGYYATWLAERHRLKAIAINPVVLASVDVAHFMGEHANFHTGERFVYTERELDELRALDVPVITQPQRYWLMGEEGDEVLDCAAAVRHYAGARQTILPGGDHSFTRFPDYLDEILAFAGLAA